MSEGGAMSQAAAPRALVLVETGLPANVDDARAWLTRVYADPAVLDTPFGADYQRLFAAVLARFRARHLRTALEAVAGKLTEREELLALATAITARLEEGGDRWLPFVAFRHAAPSMAEALREAIEAGCSHVIFLFARPFSAVAASGSAAAEVRQLAASHESLQISFISHFDEAPGVRAAFAAALGEALSSLPEHVRGDAELLFTLRGQPLGGAKRDPALDAAQPFIEAVKAAAGLENRSSIAFQCRTDPRADLAPSVEEAIEQLGSKQALVVVPLSHLAETLATRWELDVHLAGLARARGIAHFARAACPGGRPELTEALTALVRDHVRETELPPVDAEAAA